MKKVALVEDNPDNRLLVSVLLEDLYELTEYENGPEALAGIRANHYHCVLLDISLPGMDGSEVLAHLRADDATKHLKVIALTAHASSSDRERFLAEGFDDYVTKPITDEMLLLNAIARAIG